MTSLISITNGGKGDELMWIRDYRERMGLELDDLAKVVNLYRRYEKQTINGVVSDKLIHILEVCDDTVTQPVLADAIAAVCGATREQRDSIVDERYRGTWDPESVCNANVQKALVKVTGVFQDADESLPQDEKHNLLSYCKKRPVVKLDCMGNTIQSYDSISAAAKENGLNEKYVRRRCDGRIRTRDGMFTPDGYTFRYAVAWDNMSRQEKLRDIDAIY